MQPSFVAFPGTILSSKSHYTVFLRGNTPVTSRLLKPAPIDAETVVRTSLARSAGPDTTTDCVSTLAVIRPAATS
jgi:hypothetical protein